MSRKVSVSRTALLLMTAGASCLASASYASAAGDEQVSSGIETVVVTAEKREENIQSVGMSIGVASGEQLTRTGVTDTAGLVKLVPGLNYTSTKNSTPVFTIRGVGFQDNALASTQTVGVYVDEVPLPYALMTTGTVLDVQRVEVLKGPQGTLFGMNATGGAINYVANKPTDTFEAGGDFSFGRFNTADAQAYVSGPVTDDLKLRLAVRTIQGGDWQKSYTHEDSNGATNFLNGRLLATWDPVSKLSITFGLSAWQDKSDTQIPQIFGVLPQNSALIDPRIVNYPLAPHNDQAADWSACVNKSPFDPPFDTVGTPLTPGSVPISGTDCATHQQDNSLLSGSVRADYELADDMTLTFLSSYENYNRYAPMENAGMIYQDFQTLARGRIQSVFEELRLAGKFANSGDWLVGANFQHDITRERDLQTYGGGSANASLGLRDGPAFNVNNQQADTYAIFGNVSYPILPTVLLNGGVRLTQANRDWAGCTVDSGDGTWAAIAEVIKNIARGAYVGPDGVEPGSVPPSPPGTCATGGPAPTFSSPPNGGLFTDQLREGNVSWRGGVTWSVEENVMVYANISKGYKSGSFPVTGAATYAQLLGIKQESVLAYEVGFKTTPLDSLQVNGAAFYYDYTNKQLLGFLIDPVFGPLEALVNVPKSHVFGFEISGIWSPVSGLTVTPSLSYQNTRVDGCSPQVVACAAVAASSATNNPAIPAGNFHGFDAFGQLANLTGERFPYTPKVQADIDAEYDWDIGNELVAFVGANLNYASSTDAGFYASETLGAPRKPADTLSIAARTLLDLRAGVEGENWRAQVWGRNVTNEWYWNGANYFADALIRYTGKPVTYGVTVSLKTK